MVKGTVVEYFERNAAGQWESVSKVNVPEPVIASRTSVEMTPTPSPPAAKRLRNRRGLAQNHRKKAKNSGPAAQRHRLPHHNPRGDRRDRMEPNTSQNHHHENDVVDASIVVVPSSSSTTASTQQPQALREEGATLSPPNTWSSSSVELDDDSDNRLLFTCTFTLPHGQVLSSAIYAEGFSEQYLPIGSNFMKRLEAKGQSFILSAAAASVKQRIFARINMPDGTPRACELLCEFEKDRAKITVLALRSAFAPSMQPFHVFTFITKHSSTCALTHIDYASIPYLGLLPTDLIGKSLLAFVYAPDVHVVRQAHIDLHNSKGKIVKSIADLRLVAHNGSILRCQTEWSAYVNPWTRKMELVVARHRICTVPIGDADVLAQPLPGQQINVLPQVMAKTFEDELRSIMNRPVPSTSSGSGSGVGATPRQFKEAGCLRDAPFAHTFAHQAADLGVYIDKLVEHLVVNSTAQQQQKAAARKCAPPPPPPPAPATSSEPPLSYTQINCLENVHRLLKSQSRPDSPERDLEPFDERKYPTPMPLTKEVLLQHTKRFEDEYKDTWCRRLKRLSDDVPSSPSPPAKQFRPNVPGTPPPAMNWNMAQKQEFYRNFAPAPPPPPGKNYQITYTPLDDPIDKPATTPKSDVENHSSAFTAIQKHSSSTSTTPSSSIHPLVQRLIINSPHHQQSLSGGGGSPTSGTNSPPVFPNLQNSNLHILRDNNL